MVFVQKNINFKIKIMSKLVLGGEGFVGKSLVKYFEAKGETVRCIDIKSGGESQDLRFSDIDLTGIDTVYFLAWEVGGAKYLYTDDAQFNQLSWNLRLLINVFEQLQVNEEIKTVFASSQLAEEINTVYGATKRLGEIWSKLIGGVSLRFWNVYGPLEKPSERTHVVSDFVYQAVINKKIKMLTTGEEFRQFIHINDICRALEMAATSPQGSLYDVTSFEWISVKQIAEIIAGFTNAEVVPGSIKGSTPITPIYGKIPSWQAKVTIEEGLSEMVESLKKSLQ